jgi:hypothetical protein
VIKSQVKSSESNNDDEINGSDRENMPRFHGDAEHIEVVESCTTYREVSRFHLAAYPSRQMYSEGLGIVVQLAIDMT